MSDTVSVETAKRLKAAGLVWQPKEGDWVVIYTEVPYLLVEVRVRWLTAWQGDRWGDLVDHWQKDQCLWLPNASDLWRILADAQTSLHLETRHPGVQLRCIWRSDLWRNNDIESTFEGNLEEALGEAVIEMLERSKYGD